MLSAVGLNKSYGALQVVNNVSLQVGAGEMVSIVGASGAGKSTLLHLLGSLDKPDSGKVLLNNTDLLALPAKKQAAFRNANIGFVFQFHHLLPEFTALENVCIPLWVGGMSNKNALKKAEEILALVGLGSRLKHKPAELSGGEQQRVAIARALVTSPKIVMADEPTGNLDSTNAHAVNHLFMALKAEFGLTMVIVTHNEKLAKMTDRILVMQDGKLVDEINNAKQKVQ
jgi:lipoprotein-releasing system ATP-binding protein